MINFHTKNIDIITNLNEAANRIAEQEEIINRLREKIEGEKENIKKELDVDYNQMKETKDRYIELYRRAPFHLTEEEKRDYDEFRDFHKSFNVRDEEGNPDVCYHANGTLSSIIFHYYPEEFHRGTIIVECPHCHTKRKLGTFTDILNENDSPKNAED